MSPASQVPNESGLTDLQLLLLQVLSAQTLICFETSVSEVKTLIG